MFIIEEAIIFGFTQSFVIGPLTLLALREGLNPKLGIWHQLQVVLAGTIVDLMYLMLSLNGVVYFINDIRIQAFMWTGAAMMLTFMGINSFSKHKKMHKRHFIHMHHFHLAQNSFSKGFAVGLMNPMAIIFWVMVAGSMYSQFSDQISPNIFALNIISGGIMGTLLIVALTYTCKKHFNEKTLERMVTLGSASLIIYGIWFTMKAVIEWQSILASALM